MQQLSLFIQEHLLALSLGLLCLILFILYIYQLHKSSLLNHSQLQLKNELDFGLEENTRLKQHLDALNGQYIEVAKQNSSLQSSYTSLEQQQNSRLQELEHLNNLNEHKQQEIETLKEELAVQRSQVQALEQLRLSDQQRFTQGQKELEARLTNLGERMLRERSEQLSAHSQEQFVKAVMPLKEELDIFRKQLSTTQQQSSEQAGALNNELHKLQQAQVELSTQANQLSKALMAGSKSQGMWGELQLQRVLEHSGLTLGLEYEREVAGDRALDERGRPDVVINLPDQHHLIVDAKCSLTAYTAYVNAQDDEQRLHAIKAHLKSIRAHIDELRLKDYAHYQSLHSPSFVFMFVPIDGALTVALHEDAGLYEYASFNGIYLVSPSTLIPALKVVSNLWVLATQNERMRNLASEAQAVADQFEKVLEAFIEIQKKQIALDKSITSLGDRLYTGRGNLKKRLENFNTKAPVALKSQDLQMIEVANDSNISFSEANTQDHSED